MKTLVYIFKFVHVVSAFAESSSIPNGLLSFCHLTSVVLQNLTIRCIV